MSGRTSGRGASPRATKALRVFASVIGIVGVSCTPPPASPEAAPSNAPSAPPAAASAEPPRLGPLSLVAVEDWSGDVGYASVDSPDGASPFMVQLKRDESSSTAVPVVAFEGHVPVPRRFAWSGAHVAVTDPNPAGGMLLYPDVASEPIRIPGYRAWFLASGERLLVAEEAGVALRDATTGAVVARENLTQSVLAGALVKDEVFFAAPLVGFPDPPVALRVDLQPFAVRADEEALAVAHSRSGRWLAALVVDGDTGALAVRTWDGREGPVRTTVVRQGYAEGQVLELDRDETHVVVSAPGEEGAARVPYAAVELATGRKVSPPPHSALWAADAVERWERIAPRLHPLARAPRTLVPSRRGFPGVTAFAETADGAALVAIEGEVTSEDELLVGEPLLLVVEARERVRHRVPLGAGPLVSATMGLGGDGATAWLCARERGGEDRLWLLALASAELVEVPVSSCEGLRRSGDQSALLDEGFVVDLGRRERLRVNLEGGVAAP